MRDSSGLWNDLPAERTGRCLVETDTGRITLSLPTSTSAIVWEGHDFALHVAAGIAFLGEAPEWPFAGPLIPQRLPTEQPGGPCR